MKKRLATLAAISFAALLCSCNNTADTAKDNAQDTTKAKDTAVAPAIAAKPAFTPFDVVEIEHSVKDYGKWRPGFDNDSVARKENGMTYIVVGREIDKPNNLLVVLNVADVKKAKDFAASPRLKEVMTKNGVNSKPVISYYHVIRFNPDANEKKWVIVTHKVKDFDAWLKVFDGEGTDARAAQGLYDVAVARGVDDPSLVHLVFDIKDLAKAKASILSAEKKKLMLSAGVEGSPKIQFFNSTE